MCMLYMYNAHRYLRKKYNKNTNMVKTGNSR